MLDSIKYFLKRALMGLKFLFCEAIPESIRAYGVYFKERVWKLLLGIIYVSLIGLFTQNMTIICFGSIGLSFLSLLLMWFKNVSFSDIWRDWTFPQLIGAFLGFIAMGIILGL